MRHNARKVYRVWITGCHRGKRVTWPRGSSRHVYHRPTGRFGENRSSILSLCNGELSHVPSSYPLMTLTVVVGASGSGKTTFLEDVHKLHKCCYVRQYHTVRPYIQVRKIPNFEPSRLPSCSLR